VFFICHICMEKVQAKDRKNHMITVHGYPVEEKKKQKHFGRVQTAEEKLKRSLALKGRKHTPEHIRKQVESRRCLMQDPESNLKNSIWHLNKWKNMTEEERNIHVGKIVKNSQHPNKKEKSLQKLLSVLKLDYLYVGNGDFVVNGCNPDFVNHDKKKIIEFFGSRWHKSGDDLERIKKFRSKNYDCLIVWERELLDLENLISKLISFDNKEEK
jgi:hypothetical protein